MRYLRHSPDDAGAFAENAGQQEQSASALAADRQTTRVATRLLGGASHDLRQPLQAIGLWVEILRDRIPDLDIRGILGKIQETVRSAEQLLDALLDITKLDLDAIEPRVFDFYASDLLDHIAVGFVPTARKSDLALRIRRSAAIARSDPVLLERILSNFVSNALRHSKRGGVLVGCRHRARRLSFEVWDTGPGIAADRLFDIFDEFVQLNSSGHRLDCGFGLGLSIADRMAALLGHPITVRSRLGKGSCFRIEVPLGQHPRLLRPDARPDDAAAAIYGAFVVFVEDQVEQREAMEQLLHRWGCHTIVASSGGEAIAKLHEHLRAPNLLLCDYKLANNETGLGAIRALRAAIGEKIPALVISGEPSAYADAEFEASRISLLRKPVSVEQLRVRLSELLSPPSSLAA